MNTKESNNNEIPKDNFNKEDSKLFDTPVTIQQVKLSSEEQYQRNKEAVINKIKQSKNLKPEFSQQPYVHPQLQRSPHPQLQRSPQPYGTPQPYGAPQPYGTPQPYGAPHPYGQQAYSSALTNGLYGRKCPDNNMVWAILATIFCCLPFGIVAIVKSSQVEKSWAAGRVLEANAAAQSSKNWCWTSLASFIIMSIIYFILSAVMIEHEVKKDYREFEREMRELNLERSW